MCAAKAPAYRLTTRTERDTCHAHMRVAEAALRRWLDFFPLSTPGPHVIALDYYANAIQARHRLIADYDAAEARDERTL